MNFPGLEVLTVEGYLLNMENLRYRKGRSGYVIFQIVGLPLQVAPNLHSSSQDTPAAVPRIERINEML